jgi:chromosome segregation ATPase
LEEDETLVYLTNELSLWQAESQRLDAGIAQLLAGAAQQDQVAAAARARASAARADAARLSSEASALQSQAAAADAQVASLDQQIADLVMNEPDEFIEVGGRSRRNPGWSTWKTQLDALNAQRATAFSSATSLHTQANQSSAAAAQSQSAAAAADNDAATATALAGQLRQQAAQLALQKAAANQQITNITRWQQELARQPMNRTALETTASEISSQTNSLEGEYKSFVDQANAAEKRLWYLQTLAQELNSKLSDWLSQLLPAATEVANATAALNDVQTRIQHVLQRIPE